MSDPQSWDAFIEIHKQGVIIGTLLGGFMMNSAYQSFSSAWESSIQKYSAICALISSISLICMVCVSSLVIFVHSDFRYREFENKITGNDSFFMELAVLNLFLGILGVASMFCMFALLGWERSRKLGAVTTLISLFGFCFLLAAFFIVYYSYHLPIYGKLPYLPFL